MSATHYLVDNLLYSLENTLADLGSKKEQKKHEDKGAYVYIPWSHKAFCAALEIVKNLRNDVDTALKFIDVGCGIGSKVFLADRAGLDAYGIEMHPKYVEAARKLLIVGRHAYYQRADEKLSSHIIHGDGRKHNYSPYDVIYFFNPMRNQELEKQLEERIFATAKPGALILAIGVGHKPEHVSMRKLMVYHSMIIYEKQGVK